MELLDYRISAAKFFYYFQNQMQADWRDYLSLCLEEFPVVKEDFERIFSQLSHENSFERKCLMKIFGEWVNLVLYSINVNLPWFT